MSDAPKFGEVIRLDGARISRAKSSLGRASYCSHNGSLEYDPDARTIECLLCHKRMDGFDGFMALVMSWSAWTRDNESMAKEIKELQERVDHRLLRATAKVDRAWRSRRMVPTCPHCFRGIFPEDGLGDGSVNRECELERRKFSPRSAAQSITEGA